MPDDYIKKQANFYQNAPTEALKENALWRIASHTGEGFDDLDPTGKLSPEQREKAENIANNANKK